MNEIFIFAQTRSGSTLLQRAINQTEDVLIYGEHAGMLDGFATAYYAAKSSGLGDSKFMPDTLRDPKMFAPCLSCIEVTRFRSQMHKFIENTLNPALSLRWGFKEVRYRGENCRVVEFLAETFPSAKFVFLVRDPREQIQSIRSVPWGDIGPFENSLRYWMQSFCYYARSAAAIPQRSIVLDYNNLRNARKLFNWLQLDTRLSNLFKEMPRTGATENKKPLSIKELIQIDEYGALDAYINQQWNIV